MIDIKDIKEQLSIQDVYNFVKTELGGNPRWSGTDTFISQTVCHNHNGNGSHKLYYYDNSHMFHCFTECGDSFDLYTLVQRALGVTLGNAISMVLKYFGIRLQYQQSKIVELDDWDVFRKYQDISDSILHQQVQLTTYNPQVLTHLPQLIIKPWEEEGIDHNVYWNAGVRYYPSNLSVIIPHYNIDNQLVGIRERTMVTELEEFGKYKPAIINGKMYNHPLSFNLYNLNNSWSNIRKYQKAIVFESEKSCLKYATWYGSENDISVAVCGSNISYYQIKLLCSLGVNEIIIAFDRQYRELADEEWKQWTTKLETISAKYSQYCIISFIFDTEHNLKYKDSPVDQTQQTFEYLYNGRI